MIHDSLYFPVDKIFTIKEQKKEARESLIFNVAEDVLCVLEDKDISKSELAKRLGKSKSFVSQILTGGRNMTLGTLSDICFELDVKPEIDLGVVVRSEGVVNLESIVESFVDDPQKNPSENNIVMFVGFKDSFGVVANG